MTNPSPARFADLDLRPELLRALDELGYESPTPIQAETIPLLRQGRDLIGQAQTGTGKTAAFALPLLSRLDLDSRQLQVLILTPTRELAIQVAEAVQRYARRLPGFQVTPIYGGQDYGVQTRALRRGVQVVVGTPGRVMDHMRRGSLKLDGLQALVLDEADEMLRMGFIDDVEWILEQTPDQRQIALFSATMPSAIRRIAQQHMSDPAQITIRVRTATAPTIRQRQWPVSGLNKLDALTRILEAEPIDAAIVFVRTRTATAEISEKLQARGYSAVALSGDVAQAQRERCIRQVRSGQVDVLVATDVAARGLDVDRISHVINYDIPYDTEAYIHRIGRTGRAGRTGEAILFVAPRERRMLKAIERATRQPIELMQLPTTEQVNDQRIARFLQRITDTLASGDLGIYPQLIEQYQQQHNVPATDVAAALAVLLQGDTPLLLGSRRDKAKGNSKAPDQRPDQRPDKAPREPRARREPAAEGAPGQRRDTPAGHKAHRKGDAPGERAASARPSRPAPQDEPVPMERFRLEVGRDHGADAKQIIGAIANEAGLDSQFIGKLEIHADHSTIELPEGMPKAIYKDLRKVWVSGRQLEISRLGGSPAPKSPPARKRHKPPKPRPSQRPPHSGDKPPHRGKKKPPSR